MKRYEYLNALCMMAPEHNMYGYSLEQIKIALREQTELFSPRWSLFELYHYTDERARSGPHNLFAGTATVEKYVCDITYAKYDGAAASRVTITPRYYKNEKTKLEVQRWASELREWLWEDINNPLNERNTPLEEGEVRSNRKLLIAKIHELAEGEIALQAEEQVREMRLECNDKLTALQKKLTEKKKELNALQKKFKKIAKLCEVVEKASE